MADRGFVVLAVALDSAGPPAVREWIRPAQFQPGMLKLMGWSPALASRAAAPAYPCLIDERHRVGELYGVVNVPTAAWIDEDGLIARAPEPPGVTDAFRSMDPRTLEIPREAALDSQLRRQIYMDAVRDWIEKGRACRHVQSADGVRRRMRGVGADESLAGAHFRLGVWLARRGAGAAAQAALERAVVLCPESWRFRRQKIVLADPALTGQLAVTREFREAVRALGERFYYPPVEMDGMPAPLPPCA